MSSESMSELLVLLGLRMKSVAEVPALWEATGVEPEVASAVIERAAERGLVRYREGRLHGYSLTPSGLSHCERLVADELEASGARGVIAGSYERFAQLNSELLQLCTRWQLRDTPEGRALNDHSDSRYDHRVVAALEELHGEVELVLDQLAGALGRYRRYHERLTDALQRVRHGEADWFSSPSVDSYHNVWFELHEDLLVTLGLERAADTAARSAG